MILVKLTSCYGGSIIRRGSCTVDRVLRVFGVSQVGQDILHVLSWRELLDPG